VDINSLIRMAKSAEASDLHLKPHRPPMMRRDGCLMLLDGNSPLTTSDLQQAFSQLADERAQNRFSATLELDFAYTVPGLVRVRCNAAMQRGQISLALRLIPTSVPDIDSLHLPEICKELALHTRGMVIVSGPTGCGKSTTLAAMIDYMNHRESRRIVTIEDPVEYVYSDDLCSIMQRELGEDTISFVEALKHILRQDPDVILIGELRDAETAAAALTIAETGHLVFTTGHAPSAYQAVERIIDMFPLQERDLVQMRLASLLNGIMCQTLVPLKNSRGRVPAVELMLANSAVRNLIREGKIHLLANIIRTNSSTGMKLLDNSLIELYQDGLICEDTLASHCNDLTEVEKVVGNLQTRAKPRDIPQQFAYAE